MGDTKWAERVDRFKDKKGAERCISRGARWFGLNSGGMQAGRARKERFSVGRCETFKRSRDAAGRTAPEVRAA